MSRRQKFEVNLLSLVNQVHSLSISYIDHKFYNIFFGSLTVLALVEPVLIGLTPFDADYKTDKFYQAQIIVFFIAFSLYFLGLFFTLIYVYHHEEGKHMSILGKFYEITNYSEMFEGFCLLWGVTFIFWVPGIACLRCIRVFSPLYYLERKNTRALSKEAYNPAEHALNFAHVAHTILNYFAKLFNEIFTEASRGGLFVITLYFYVTYLFAILLYNMANDLITPEGQSCGDISTCFIRLIRLSLNDGTLLVKL